MSYVGDVPTSESSTTALILRKRLPCLMICFVIIVNLNVHGLRHQPFDGIFTMDKPVIFASHGLPYFVEKLIFGRNRSKNFSVYGYDEEGTISTAFLI